MQCFRGDTIALIQNKISSHQASINFKHTIIHVGTNDIPSRLQADVIMCSYENLIMFVRSKSYTNLIISAIIPRPCDLPSDSAETCLKAVNNWIRKAVQTQKSSVS